MPDEPPRYIRARATRLLGLVPIDGLFKSGGRRVHREGQDRAGDNEENAYTSSPTGTKPTARGECADRNGPGRAAGGGALG
jgi:hypothetical protein